MYDRERDRVVVLAVVVVSVSLVLMTIILGLNGMEHRTERYHACIEAAGHPLECTGNYKP